MKRVIKASSQLIIFEDENFVFAKVLGVGRNDTPYEGLEIITKKNSLAYKHVVEVRLNLSNSPRFEGSPVKCTYSDAYVVHGTRGTMDTLEETAEYIDVLEDALDFANRVNAWLWNEGIDPGDDVEFADLVEDSFDWEE